MSENSTTEVEYVVHFGSAGLGSPLKFSDLQSAETHFQREVEVPSYMGPGHRRRATLVKRTIITEILKDS